MYATNELFCELKSASQPVAKPKTTQHHTHHHWEIAIIVLWLRIAVHCHLALDINALQIPGISIVFSVAASYRSICFGFVWLWLTIAISWQLSWFVPSTMICNGDNDTLARRQRSSICRSSVASEPWEDFACAWIGAGVGGGGGSQGTAQFRVPASFWEGEGEPWEGWLSLSMSDADLQHLQIVRSCESCSNNLHYWLKCRDALQRVIRSTEVFVSTSESQLQLVCQGTFCVLLELHCWHLLILLLSSLAQSHTLLPQRQRSSSHLLLTLAGRSGCCPFGTTHVLLPSRYWAITLSPCPIIINGMLLAMSFATASCWCGLQ